MDHSEHALSKPVVQFYIFYVITWEWNKSFGDLWKMTWCGIVQDSQSYLLYRFPRKTWLVWPINVIYTTTMFVNHSRGFQSFIQDPFSLICGHTLIDCTQKFSFFTKTNFDLDLDLIFYSHYLSLTIILVIMIFPGQYAVGNSATIIKTGF